MPLQRLDNIAFDWSKVYAMKHTPYVDTPDSEKIECFMQVPNEDFSGHTFQIKGMICLTVWKSASEHLAMAGKIAVNSHKISAIYAEKDGPAVFFELGDNKVRRVQIELYTARTLLDVIPLTK